MLKSAYIYLHIFMATNVSKVFTVPHTHDMVSQLLSPTQPKNLSDAVVIVVMSVHVLALWLLPRNLSIPLFAVVFLFWRSCYNGGIGYVLQEQSNYNSIVKWAKKSGIFQNPASGKNTKPQLYSLLKREMETKIPKDYKFDEAPVEYNTWLLFRRVVDLILMCDFVSYFCFAIACGGMPAGEHYAMTVGRWIAGLALFFFNLWVKLDAHRVVKDYAWYWGDFFFLIDQELTFDGVFEMAPHPMYSVGYAGYYGISLMAASYKVLFISIIAHSAQFAFLAIVENPHIEKTYNPPPPRKQLFSPTEPNGNDLQDSDASIDSPIGESQRPPFVRDIIGIENIDLHRVVDITTILLQFYVYSLALLTPSTAFYQAFFVINAIAWRLWYSIGVGYLLDRQSKKKKWTRHYIKYGENTEEAWRQWKGVYHVSMTMCYVSFVAASYKMYSLPPDWEYGMSLLRHVLGVALIALQLWTVFSIYESLGEFGWFFGDFFFERGPKLTYSGIYRFLNNPERVIGLAGVWGFAIITWSKAIFFLALLSHLLSLCFIQFVERPHMQKRYGQRLRAKSGLSNSVQRSLPPFLQGFHSSIDQALDSSADMVEEFIEVARPKIEARVEALMNDIRALLRNYPARAHITRLADNLSEFNSKDYKLEFEGTNISQQAFIEKVSGREGDLARSGSFRGAQHLAVTLEYGSPIKVKWTAPTHHGKKDWVGLYMIADNTSREVTRVASQGRWISTTKGVYDSARSEEGLLVSDKQTIQWDNATKRGDPLSTGEMEFAGDKLWWTTGVFEFRYHHDGKHNVLAISRPFEIRIAKFDFDDVEVDSTGSVRTEVEKILLPIVRNCFDRDPEIAPNSPEEAFGSLVEREGKFARRVVFAVWHMCVSITSLVLIIC